MAKPSVKTRKRVIRTVVDGVAHIHASFNNTIVTITDRQGNAAIGLNRLIGFQVNDDTVLHLR